MMRVYVWAALGLASCDVLVPDTPTPAQTPAASPTPSDPPPTTPEITPTPGPIPAAVHHNGLREATDAECSDGIDNDSSGKTDCDDYGCKYTSSVTVCGTPHSGEDSDSECSDGSDNDGDGYRDCADWSCLWNADVAVCDRDNDGYKPVQGDCFDHPELDMADVMAPSIPEMCGDREDNNCDGTAEEAGCFQLNLGARRIQSISDGDTIQVEGLGPVRFKGIDTPETYPETECYGGEAKAYTTAALADMVVYVMLDPTDYHTDFKDETPSHRWLGHLYLLDGSYLNGDLVQGGLACVWTSYPCMNKVELLEWQDQAQDKDVGLWDACGGSVCF